jgi:outer membrane protein OmpA-like peptidoglycan-associated protein
MSHRVYGAHGFQVRGYGEADPVAPNRRPDGSDNPAGRRQNRRVEVKFKGQIPAL